ncbi:MAG: UvrD-helicase domain-containing protein [Chitinophagaceae bacterium]|nr:UvrD-helicase domain-containing protein [Chitinophagaceae bacterium]
MRQNEILDFNVFEVPLDSKNLVEASAGTGKTFSIAILVLRMVLEKNIPVNQILLVTFTKNAVAELEERIRQFVRKAQECITTEKDHDDPVQKVISGAIAKGIDPEEIKLRIKGALLFLDELSIMTIHGFCQQSLANQSFETGQLFGGEVVSSLDDLFLQYAMDFWRTKVNTLPVEDFALLKSKDYSFKSIMEVLKNHASGKHYFYYDERITYRIERNILQGAKQAQQEITAIEDQCAAIITQNREEIEQVLRDNRYAREKLLPQLEAPQKLLDILAEKDQKQYYNLLVPFGINDLAQRRSEKLEEISASVNVAIYKINCYAIQTLLPKIDEHLAKAGMLSFDKLIFNLHTAITGNNRERITQHLQSQYQAVFIDEFQDTDRLQYEIFKTAFSGITTVFYVGDPKQSIYGWRQADINTYFKARSEVDRRYTMNTNFRSSHRLIEAMNCFFKPEPGFDTFYFRENIDTIKYILVSAPRGAAQNLLLYDGKPVTPIQIYELSGLDAIRRSASGLILTLLTDKKFKILKDGKELSVLPKDISILVRGNDHGAEMKDRLNKIGIPAVIISHERIMESTEALEMLRVLKAMFDPDLDKIHTALVSSFTPYNSTEVIKLNKERLTELFRKYKTLWETRGVNEAISSFITDFGIRNYLSDPQTENGLRIISNINQISELLFKTEYHQKLKQAELLEWMQRATELDLIQEDEKEIRLENDADSVTISTIHAAKGLEYPIVIAPQLDLVPDFRNGKSHTIYIPENITDTHLQPFAGKYLYYPDEELDDKLMEIARTQEEQENRRLIYVTVTRAVYGCFIFKNTSKDTFNESGLTKILDGLKNNPPSEDLIKIHTTDAYIPAQPRYVSSTPDPAKAATLNGQLSVLEPNWQFMSYSGLTAKSAILPPAVLPVQRTPEAYDTFVFERLRRGPVTGTMIHEILEKINFTQSEKHDMIIDNIVKRYTLTDIEYYKKHLPELARQVLSAVMSDGDNSFSLNQISREKRLQELEFDFSVNTFDTTKLKALGDRLKKNIQLRGENTLSGMMNGFIDLFFEHDGKYYVLDWKTNFLGNQVESYTGASLDQAMDEWNYHLQYLIYTLAAKKYLQQRLGKFDYSSFGGVIYCFIRGMREGESSGVYFFRPTEDDLKELEEVIG